MILYFWFLVLGFWLWGVVPGCGFLVVGFWLGYLFLLRNLHWKDITNQKPTTQNPQPSTTTIILPPYPLFWIEFVTLAPKLKLQDVVSTDSAESLTCGDLLSS